MPGGRLHFITGTDTDVGKTVAAAWLASTLAPTRRVALVKLFQTGSIRPSIDGDEAFYRARLGRNVSYATLETLPEPLAPSIAAERAGVELDIDRVVTRCRGIANRHDVTLVEGAGGLLVTIDETHDMAALALELEAPLVLVIRPGLGTLNHTLLTVEAAERRGLSVDLLICSAYPDGAGTVEAENMRFLHRRFPETPIVVLRRADFEGGEDLDALRPRLIGGAPPLLAGATLMPFEFSGA